MNTNAQVGEIWEIESQHNGNFHARLLRRSAEDIWKVEVINPRGNVTVQPWVTYQVHVDRLVQCLAPTDTNPTNPTNPTKENTDMNTNYVINAITNLRQQDANAAVEPVYREVVKLIGKVKVGRGVVQYWVEQERDEMQFWFRSGADQWQYGNGASLYDTDHVVSVLVKRQVQYGGRIVRLVKAK